MSNAQAERLQSKIDPDVAQLRLLDEIGSGIGARYHRPELYQDVVVPTLKQE